MFVFPAQPEGNGLDFSVQMLFASGFRLQAQDPCVCKRLGSALRHGAER